MDDLMEIDGLDGVVDQKNKELCVAAVTDLFPDISLAYVNKIAKTFKFDRETVVNHIMDEVDNGKPYQKKSASSPRKRKHDDSEELEKPADVLRKYDKATQPKKRRTLAERGTRMNLIIDDFPHVTHDIIQNILNENHWRLFPSYTAVQKISWKMTSSRQKASKTGAKHTAGLNSNQNLGKTPAREYSNIDKELLEELKAAQQMADWNDRNERPQFQAKLETDAAKVRGALIECQCCFDEFLDRTLVRCQSESQHRFCVSCMRQYAATLVGSSTYQMSCLSTGNRCSAGFSAIEKSKFLDKKLQMALDRIEAETALRLAGLDSLETCPFCPYAAEYPSVEDNKEFRCENPECAIVSCRLCRKETHLPKKCEEAVQDTVMEARRVIEEAMSDALIRRCKKCQTPFIKEDGCNRMRCAQAGCGHYQCYICGESVTKDYSHFQKKGSTCKIWDNSEERHQKDVKEAEELTRKKVAEKNPELGHEQLAIKHSKEVTADMAKARKAWRNHHGYPRVALRADIDLGAWVGDPAHQEAILNGQRPVPLLMMDNAPFAPPVPQLGVQPAAGRPPAAQNAQERPQPQHPQMAQQNRVQGHRQGEIGCFVDGLANAQAVGYVNNENNPPPDVALFDPARHRRWGALQQQLGIHAGAPQYMAARLNEGYGAQGVNDFNLQRLKRLQMARQQYLAGQAFQAQHLRQPQAQPVQNQQAQPVQPNQPQNHRNTGLFGLPPYGQVQNWLRDVASAVGVSSAPAPARPPVPVQQFQGQQLQGQQFQGQQFQGEQLQGQNGQSGTRSLRPLPHRLTTAHRVSQANPLRPGIQPAHMQQNPTVVFKGAERGNGDGLAGTPPRVRGRELQFGRRYGNLAALDNVAGRHGLQRPLG